MSIWFQDDAGNFPKDMPNVLGYAVLHPDLDDYQVHTKAAADEIAATLDGALVYGVVDVITDAELDDDEDDLGDEYDDMLDDGLDEDELAEALGMGIR